MKTHALLLLFMLTAAAEMNTEKRIYNGQDCPDTERLYHVKIERITTTKTHIITSLCGGSLINRRWVLTAAHCGDGKTDLTLTLGVHGGTPEQQVITAAQQKKGSAIFTREDDIMLLRLNTDTALPFIRLPPRGCNRPVNGQDIKVGGFGLFTAEWNSTMNQYVEGGPTAAIRGMNLQCATMTTTQCDRYFPFWPFTFNQRNAFCYEGVEVGRPGVVAVPVGVPAPPAPTATDICSGDSGGALEYGGLIYGVIIRGYDEMCAGPAEASDVCFYRKWIHKVLTEKKYDLDGRDPVGDPDY